LSIRRDLRRINDCIGQLQQSAFTARGYIVALEPANLRLRSLIIDIYHGIAMGILARSDQCRSASLPSLRTSRHQLR